MAENYSYSKIDTYHQCPFKFKLRYVDGNYITGGSVATEVGTMIHAAEESIANAIKAGETINYADIKSQICMTAFEIQQKYPEDYLTADKTGKTYEDKVVAYLDKGIYALENYMKAHPTYEIVGAEIPFEFNYSDQYIFKGFIDRMFRDTATNTYIVQDIKTWAQPKESKDLATPLQFVVYTLAVKQMYNCSEENIKCQYYLPFCEVTQDAGTKGFIKRGLATLNKTFNRIKDNDFKPDPTPLCHWCEYCSTNKSASEESKYLCPYFMKWTKENKDFSKQTEWYGIEAHQVIQENYLRKMGKIN